MIRVNLLPYRVQRRREQVLRHLLAAVAVLFVVGAGIAIAHGYASSELSSLEERYAELRRKNAVLQRKIGEIRNIDRLRAEVQDKLRLVDQLQQGRFASFRMLLSIARTIPQNAWITEMRDSGGKIELKGIAESPAAIASFMRALEASPEFANVRLGVVRRTKLGNAVLRSFTLTMQREGGGA